MGFNNGGVDEMAGRLKRLSDRSIIVGGNIGKNKDTPLEKAHEDYLICFEKLYDLVDYFVVNVSSPNTPGLRSLQDKGPLIKILKTLINARESKDQDKPILVKIAPDLNEGQLNDIIDISNDLPIEGIIATNTTISRADLITSESELNAIGNGGLSGAPLFSRSNEVLSILKGKLSADKVLIGVGGIQDKDSALGKIRNGADLIQIYTGFVYEGPFFIKRIKKALANDLNF
jgi:dihydroorotate dehydrogenase